MNFNKRIHTPELIDLGPSHYTESEYLDCLYKLDKIGRYLGGDRATFSAFKSLKSLPKTILDVGCGAGLFTQKLAKQYPHASVTGLDTSEKAIEIAQNAIKVKSSPLKNLQFTIPESPYLNYPRDYFDVITCTLMCHHLSDEDLIDFLKRSYQMASQAVIINDLHRSRLATVGFSIIAPLFFRNRLILNDGLLSIKKAFTKKDWERYLRAAKIPLERCHLQWHWAFRWTLTIDSRKS